MAPVCLEARRTMVAQGKMPPSVHDFALEELRRANSEACTLLRHAPGWQKSTHVFMPGCQLAASRPDSVAILYARLREHLGPEVGLMLRCCGAPAEWAGREDLLEASLVTLREGVQEMGNPTVVVACPTCADILERRAPDVTSVSLYEVLAAGAGASPAVPATSRATLAVHDPCTARHHARTRAAVRDLLAGAGWPVEELPLSGERTECCGFGGLMLYADRELADEVVARRAACSSQPFVTYCAMCRDRYAAAGKPAIHVIDVLLDGAAALESAAVPGPGLVERHEARVRLKEELLRDIWGERVGPEHHTEIVVEMDEELRRALEEQLVRLDDVRAVIAHAERSRAFFVDSASGRRLASYRPRAVTYWVQYSPAETGYVLHGVYTHRMEVEGVEGGE
ncbi:MAG: (Fe-S)-binding protein [Actinobacteria bacterium]|nr:(Fe-S)-binding protein [Actinomycetota bacterium]